LDISEKKEQNGQAKETKWQRKTEEHKYNKATT